jgi:hypothetical protein
MRPDADAAWIVWRWQGLRVKVIAPLPLPCCYPIDRSHPWSRSLETQPSHATQILPCRAQCTRQSSTAAGVAGWVSGGESF